MGRAGRAALWMVLSAAGASGMSVATRVLSRDVAPEALSFLRLAFGALLIAPMILQGRSALRVSRPWSHAARGALFGASTLMGFIALAGMPLATATALFFLAPIFVTAFSALTGAERVGPWRWGAIAAGFAGALIILRPGAAPIDGAALAALGSTLTFSAALMIGRAPARADGALSVMATTTIGGAIATAPVMLFWPEAPGSAREWLLLAALVGCGSLRTFADVKAYALADAGFLAPFAYLRLVITAVLAWSLLGEKPDAAAWLGAAVITGASAVIAWREAVHKRRQGPEAAPDAR